MTLPSRGRFAESFGPPLDEAEVNAYYLEGPEQTAESLRTAGAGGWEAAPQGRRMHVWEEGRQVPTTRTYLFTDPIP